MNFCHRRPLILITSLHDDYVKKAFRAAGIREASQGDILCELNIALGQGQDSWVKTQATQTLRLIFQWTIPRVDSLDGSLRLI